MNKKHDYKKECEKLKKQLEEINKFKFSYRKDETKIPPVIRKQNDVEIIKNLETQQKEFIEYLENEIKYLKIVPLGCKTSYLDGKKHAYIEILSKYKEIIGVSDEKK